MPALLSACILFLCLATSASAACTTPDSDCIANSTEISRPLGSFGASAYSPVPAHIPISVAPPLLHYDAWPIAIPKIAEIELTNDSEDDALDVHSITSSSADFHVAEVPLTALPPGGRLPLSVVFLPRAHGVTNATLLVQTSHGGFFYELQGVGAANPYGVEPLQDFHLPHGSPFNPQITLRNPHAEEMRIKEVFTSESFLHLSLPPQANLEPQDGVPVNNLWKLDPGESKAVVALSFAPPIPGRYLGYVHFNTDFDNIVLPFDIKVVPSTIRRFPEVRAERERESRSTRIFAARTRHHATYCMHNRYCSHPGASSLFRFRMQVIDFGVLTSAEQSVTTLSLMLAANSRPSPSSRRPCWSRTPLSVCARHPR